MTNKELLEFNKNRRICQLALVTGRPLAEVMQEWIDKVGIGPWTVIEMSDRTTTGVIMDGQPHTGPFCYHVAVAMYGNFQIEIMKPEYGVPMLEDFLAQKGGGLQHMKEVVPDKDQPAYIQRMADNGIGIKYSGHFFDDTFLNFDTVSALGFTLEIGNNADLDYTPATSAIPSDVYSFYPSASAKITPPVPGLSGDERFVCQVCLASERNIEDVLHEWVDKLQVGPWTVLTLNNDNVQNPIMNGQPVTHPFSYKCATALYGNIQIEIVQPEYGVPALQQFVEQKGAGLQHFKECIPDAQQPAYLQHMAQQGVGVAYSGRVLKDTYVNFDTVPTLGLTLEIGNYADNPLPEGSYYTYPRET